MNNLVNLLQNLPFRNLDLLSVGAVIAAIGILGFVIYLNNRKNTTNRSFAYLSITIIFWSIFNYLNYQSNDPILTLFLLRLLMFSAVWFAFTLFQLLLVFPSEKFEFSKSYRNFLVPVVTAVSCVALTPLLFQSIQGTVEAGTVAAVKVGPGIIAFAATVLPLVIYGVTTFIRKTIRSQGEDRKRFRIVLIGIIITFSLIILLNFILPAFFGRYEFIPLGALFIFPFVAFTAYAIFKRGLFNIRAATVAVLTFVLTMGAGLEIIFSTDLASVLLRSGIFILVLAVSILMNKFVETIAEQKEQLETANKAQAETMNFITHQIRGVFADTKAGLSAIIDGDYGAMPGEINNVTHQMFEAQNRGVSAVETFLKAARIESGTVEYDMKALDFKRLVTQLVEQGKARAENKKLTYAAHLSDGEYVVEGDGAYLEQVVSNLIDNAIRYTPTGSVEVSLSRVDSDLLFSVKDSGIGVNDEDGKKLFTKYGHGKDSRKINAESNGLGLFIVKGIVEKHRGKIWYQSDGSGKGTTFFVRLPTVQKSA